MTNDPLAITAIHPVAQVPDALQRDDAAQQRRRGGAGPRGQGRPGKGRPDPGAATARPGADGKAEPASGSADAPGLGAHGTLHVTA